jgi:transcriptional regulator GlxA family with amidase domain
MKLFNLLLLLIIVGSGWKCHPEESSRTPVELHEGWLKVGILIMDGVYNTELTAPKEIFHHTAFRKGITPMDVFTIADTYNQIRTFEGLHIVPDYNYLKDRIPNLDILVIPSAEHHLDSDLDNSVLIDYVRETAARTRYNISLCDGAFVFAQAGVLDSVVSTTFPGDIVQYRKRFPHLDVRDSVSFVHDDKFITSAGGAQSFDAALYLVEVLYGKEIAGQIAKGLVIDWDLERVARAVVR